MKPSIFITSHCRGRFRERTPYYQTREQDYMCECAFNKGYKLADFSYDSPFYRFLNSKQASYGVYTVCVWKEFIYVFKNDTHTKMGGLYVLCTVYPVPDKFLPIESHLCSISSPCVIEIVDDSGRVSYVSQQYALGMSCDIDDATIFKSVEAANNYVKNNRDVLDYKWEIIKL